MSDEQQWESYRQMAEEVAATVTDDLKREAYQRDARRLAGVFREVSVSPMAAATTVASISRLMAVIAMTPAVELADVIDQCIITYAIAAGILADDPEVNSQPEDGVISLAKLPGQYM